jgi:general secretion pathway protein K
MTRSPRRQRGVALLVALLVVALATILIAALLDRGELAYARTRNALRVGQAEAYAQGLEAYAVAVLLSAQRQGPDSNASPWAMPMPPQPVPGGLIGATMRDLNGCFNLNNLSQRAKQSGDWKTVFANLLTQLGLDTDIAKAVEAWLGDGTDDANRYLAQPVPYRPRHDVFAHVSELRLVQGVSAEAYARLAPHVCALPPGTKINVNTATPQVLASIDSRITPAIAQSLWNGGQANFQGLDAFATQARISIAKVPYTMYDVRSTYFLARGEVSLDGVPLTFFSLIGRDQGGYRVFERSRGADDALAAPVVIGRTGSAPD